MAKSAADAEIQQQILGSVTYDSGATTLIMSNKEMKDIMKTVNSLKFLTMKPKNKETDFLVSN